MKQSEKYSEAELEYRIQNKNRMETGKGEYRCHGAVDRRNQSKTEDKGYLE